MRKEISACTGCWFYYVHEVRHKLGKGLETYHHCLYYNRYCDTGKPKPDFCKVVSITVEEEAQSNAEEE